MKIAAAGVIAVLAAVLAPASAPGQPGAVTWDSVYSSLPDSDSDHAKALVIDDLGNIIVTGYLSDRTGNHDFLTVKYDPYGAVRWVKAYDFSWNDVATAATKDATGNVIVAGSSENDARPSNPYLGSYYTDYRVVKYDPYGDLLFEMGATGFGRNNVPSGVVVDSDGGIYVTGYARNSGDTHPVYFTVKFDPAGIYLWEGIGNWDTDAEATAIALDGGGNVVVTGHFLDFANNNHSIRTIRYSPNGEVLMDVTYDDKYGDETANALAVDPDGNIVITGRSGEDGGKTLTVKLGPDGEPLWATTYEGSSYPNQGNAVAIDRHGRIYVAGKTSREEQAGDFLLLVYGSDGTLIDDQAYAFGGDSGAVGVAMDAYDSIIMAGTTELAGEPAVFRTIRVEGYPLPRKSRVTPETAFSNEEITLYKPVLPMPRRIDMSVTRSGPAERGAALIFTAETVDSPGEYEYRFLMNNSINKYRWEPLTEYSDNNFWIVVPSTEIALAKIMVQVRRKGSWLDFEARKVVELENLLTR